LPVSGALQFIHSDAFARFCVGQEEIPEPLCARLVFHAFQQFQLPGRVAPAFFAIFAHGVKLFGYRIDFFGNKALHLVI
jgi:hypothetical protein